VTTTKFSVGLPQCFTESGSTIQALSLGDGHDNSWALLKICFKTHLIKEHTDEVNAL